MHLGLKTGPSYPIFYIKLKGALFLQQSSRWAPPYLIPQLPWGPKEKEHRYKWQSYYVQLPSTGVPPDWSPPLSLPESPIAELSVESELFSISIPQDQGKYLVHQAEPLHLAWLTTTRRWPGIPEGAVKDRLAHCHSSHRHGTHTVGFGIVFKGLLL